jgi:hypothetical protein
VVEAEEGDDHRQHSGRIDEGVGQLSRHGSTIIAAMDYSLELVIDMQGVKFASFSDPDGNLWLLQQFPAKS